MVTVIFFAAPSLWAAEDKLLFSRAQKAALEGKQDFAFMQYRSILNNHADSQYEDEALFANAEYYYLISHYSQAHDLFLKYLNTSSLKSGKLFALVYLYKISLINKDRDLAETLRRRILTFQRQSFIFKKTKEYVFKSPLFRRHKAVYDIEKIEISVEGESFAKILY